MSFSDSEIIGGILEGGVPRERMVQQLFDQYSGWIRNGVKKHRLNEEEVLDAYTDAILGGVDQIISGKFERKSQLSTWLFQIFSNKCVDRIRQKSTHKYKQHQQWTNDLIHLGQEDREIVARLVQDERLAQLSSLIDQLGERCKQLIWDTEYWGYELGEIASKLGLKDARSASTQKYRCMEKLRHLIRKKMGKHV